jgi:DNA-binding NarL/FixJ family response regulator
MSERIVARVTGRGEPPDATAPFERLTDREREVLALMGRGLGTREIAQQLSLSVKTVETHQARIKEKLGLTHVRELTRAAVNWGLQ